MRPRLDEHERMLAQAMMLAIVFWSCFLFALAGCTVKHEAPQLDRIEDTVRKITIAGCQKQHLAMPPIPQDVVLDIKGDKITANEGGETLLRFYSQARQLLR